LELGQDLGQDQKAQRPVTNSGRVQVLVEGLVEEESVAVGIAQGDIPQDLQLWSQLGISNRHAQTPSFPPGSWTTTTNEEPEK
jgi:hypothetical protein